MWRTAAAARERTGRCSFHLAIRRQAVGSEGANGNRAQWHRCWPRERDLHLTVSSAVAFSLYSVEEGVRRVEQKNWADGRSSVVPVIT